MDWVIWEEIYFVNYYQSKKHKQRFKIKKTILQSYRRMSNQNTKKSSGIKFAFFNCAGKMGMDNFGCLNSSLSLFYFYFATNLRKKKLWRTCGCNWTSPSPYTSQYAFRWTAHPPPRVRTLWMTPWDNSHSRESNIVTLSNNFFLTLCCLTLNDSVTIKAIRLPLCSIK